MNLFACTHIQVLTFGVPKSLLVIGGNLYKNICEVSQNQLQIKLYAYLENVYAPTLNKINLIPVSYFYNPFNP